MKITINEIVEAATRAHHEDVSYQVKQEAKELINVEGSHKPPITLGINQFGKKN